MMVIFAMMFSHIDLQMFENGCVLLFKIRNAQLYRGPVCRHLSNAKSANRPALKFATQTSSNTRRGKSYKEKREEVEGKEMK